MNDAATCHARDRSTAATFRSCIVDAVEEITPRVRRLILSGPEVASFATPPGALGPYVKLGLRGPCGGMCQRTYSIRRLDLTRCEMHIDIVRHEGQSLCATFLAGLRRGAEVSLCGPGFIVAEPSARYLVAGDHTAVGAAAHIVDNLPGSADVRVILEVPDGAEEQSFDASPRVKMDWLHRHDDAASELAPAACDIFDREGGDLFVWAGAEAGIARAIRRHVRGRGVPAARCQVLNYWKRGVPEGTFSYVV